MTDHPTDPTALADRIRSSLAVAEIEGWEIGEPDECPRRAYRGIKTYSKHDQWRTMMAARRE